MIRYTVDVLALLKDAGYNQTRIQREKLLPHQTLTNIKAGRGITFDTLSKICAMSGLQPGDIIEYVPDDRSEG